MELTLNKANKLLQKLKEQNLSFPSVYSISSMAFNSVDLECEDSFLAFKATIAQAKDIKETELQANLKILEDTSSLKEALFTANVTSGLSKLMRVKDLATTKLNKFKHLLKEVESETVVEEISKSFVAIGQDPEKSRYERYGVALLTKSELGEIITSLTSQINDLEDQIAVVNASSKLTIEFSDATKKVLGLR